MAANTAEDRAAAVAAGEYKNRILSNHRDPPPGFDVS
jgi:hypothetical protein